MLNLDTLLLDSIFNALPSGMIFINLATSALRLNAKAKELLGLPADCTLTRLTQPPPPYLQPLWQLLSHQNENIQRAEISLQLPHHEEESMLGYGLKHIALPKGTLSIFTFSDITQINKDRLAMDKIKDELNQSKKLASIGTMIAGVAHEMNNPLTGISMSTALIRLNLERLKKQPAIQQAPPISENLDKALQEIQKIMRASEKASILVNDLLAYSKPTQLFLEPCNLHELVLDIVNALKSHPKFYQFNIQVTDTVSHLVLCDRIKLEQVFYNLITNACEATDGRGTLSIFYSEGILPDGKPAIQAHVRDNGPGIDKTIISRIFDPFFTTKGHSGVGLGLSICYRTLEQHGGLLSVDSVKWEGTQFNVALPIYTPPDPL